MGVGVDAFGLYAVRLDGGKGRSGAAGIDFFKQGDSGSAADDLSKGGAAVKFRISNTVLKYGDQMPSLPVLSYDNSRLLPESYSGTLITSKEIEGLELNAGRFTAESRKSAEGRDSGGLKSINVFGGKYAFTDHFNASLYASDVEDVLKKQYINLNYTIPLQADQSLNFDFNGYRTKLDSDFADQNFNGNRDNKIWSLAASYTIDAHTFMIAHQRNTGDTGYNYGWYQNAGGIGDGGTTIWLANSYWSDFNAEDERSWQVSYALDFAKYGVPGLTYRVAYVRGDNIKTAETSNGKEREIFNQVQYVVQSGPARTSPCVCAARSCVSPTTPARTTTTATKSVPSSSTRSACSDRTRERDENPGPVRVFCVSCASSTLSGGAAQHRKAGDSIRSRLPLLIDIDNAVPETPSAPSSVLPCCSAVAALASATPTFRRPAMPALREPVQCRSASARPSPSCSSARTRRSTRRRARPTTTACRTATEEAQVLPLPAAQLRFRRRLPGRVPQLLPVLRRHHPPHRPPGLRRDVRQASRTCGNTVRRRRSTCAPSPLPPRYHAGPAR